MPTSLLTGFGALMILGVPLGLVIIGSSILFLFFDTSVPMTVVVQRIFAGLDDFTLMAIPLFILAGHLMNEIGLTERIILLAKILTRKIYAGLAQVSVFISMLYGGVSGAAAADLAAVGIPMIPEMEKDGYKREFAVSTITASSLMGAIIPPSIPFIIYGVQAETSIGALFVAGIIPGILLGVTVLIVNYIVLKKQNFVSVSAGKPLEYTKKELVVSVRDALLAVLMPVVIIGGILTGIFTPTEASGVAVFYALAIGLLVFRSVTIKKLMKVLYESVIMSAAVMIIIAASAILNWVLAFSKFPTLIAELLLTVTDNQYVFLLIVIIILLIVGMPLDPVPAIIILTPVLLPAALEFGVDPVHFGVVMVLGLTIGLATPPVGASLFVAMSISKVSMAQISKSIIPFLVAILILTLFITFIPEIYNWIFLLGG